MGLLYGLLAALAVVPGGKALSLLAALAGLFALLYLVGWRWPLEYVLTDTHLRVKRGLLAVRWVPLDQIRTVARLPRDSDYLHHGFSALAGSQEVIIVNPELGDLLWVAFTPSDDFLRTLLWQIGRSGPDLDPLPPGPPKIQRVFRDDDEDTE